VKPLVDVSKEPDPHTAAPVWMAADIARPMDLTRGPLFSYALTQLRSDLFVWYYTVNIESRRCTTMASKTIDITLTSIEGCTVTINGTVSYSILPATVTEFKGTVTVADDDGFPIRCMTFSKNRPTSENEISATLTNEYSGPED
jgi:hypothetical protein